MRFNIFLNIAMALPCTVMAAQSSWSGNVATEMRRFAHEAQFSDQDFKSSISLSLEPEFVAQWRDGAHQFRFVPYARIDQHDEDRSHLDLRELNYNFAAPGYELRLGIRKVFWGVTESQHLVDVINQTDLVEQPDGEAKLGQMMINIAVIGDFGTLDFFVLPGMRERTFPGHDGRLRPGLTINVDHPQFESDQKQAHIDFAMRWSRSIGDADLGLAYFNGTRREPLLLPTVQAERVLLNPYYELMRQISIDAQLTKSAWLWKLEAIYRETDREDYGAGTAGVEYTFFDAAATGIDIGLLSEYAYDHRDERADTIMQDDAMLGIRVALNDIQSTQALFAVIQDRKTQARLSRFEMSRRLGERWRLTGEFGLFSHVGRDILLRDLGRDDYAQIELAYFFN